MNWFLRHKKTTAVIIVGIIYVTFQLFSSPSSKYDNYIQKAHQTMFFPMKLTNLRKAAKVSPYFGGLYFAGLGMVHEADYEQGEQFFLELVTKYGHMKNRRIAEAYSFLASLQVRKNNTEEAIAYYKKSIEADPTLGDVYELLADMYWGEPMVEILLEGIKNAPKIECNYNALLEYYLDTKNMSQTTLEEFKKLIPIDGATGKILSNLGHEVLLTVENRKLAKELHQLALAKDDTSAESYHDLGGIYRLEGRLKEAEAALKRAIRLKHELIYYVDLALLYIEQGRDEEAITNLTIVAGYSTAKESDVYLQLAKANYRLGRYRAAYEWLIDSDETEVSVSELKTQLEKTEEVQQYLAEIANIGENPTNKELKRIKYLVEKYEQSLTAPEQIGVKGTISLLEQTLAETGAVNNELTAKMHTSLGALLRREDDRIGAKNHFEQAIKLNPAYGETYSGLALCTTGQEREKLFLQGIATDPWEESNYIGLVKHLEESNKKPINFSQLKEVLPLTEAPSPVLAQLGDYFYSAKKEELALEFYQRAIGKSDNDMGVHQMLGNIYLNKKEYAQAKVHYQEALTHDALYLFGSTGVRFQNYYNLANVCYELGEYQETVNLMIGVVEEEYEYPGKGVLLLAKAYNELGDYENTRLWADKLPSSSLDTVGLKHPRKRDK